MRSRTLSIRVAASCAVAAVIGAGLLSLAPAQGESSSTVTLGGSSAWITATGLPAPDSGQDVNMWNNNSSVSKNITVAANGSSITVLGRGTVCSGSPIVSVAVDGTVIGTASFTADNAYQLVSVGSTVTAGTHTVTLKLTNDYNTSSCDRNAYIANISSMPAKPTASNTGVAVCSDANHTTVRAGDDVYGVNASGARIKVGTLTTSSTDPYANGVLNLWNTINNVTISGYNIIGRVNVYGTNVTIADSCIRGVDLGAMTTSPAALYFSRNVDGTSNNKIVNSTIRPDSYYVDSSGATKIDPRWIGLAGGGFTADHDNLSGAVDLVQTTGSGVALTYNYLHDNTQYPVGQDPYLILRGDTTNPSHSDAWQIEGGSNLVAKGNNFLNSPWTAILTTQNTSKTDSLTINSNWLGGGSCTLNLADNKTRGVVTNVAITNNVFTGTNTNGVSTGYPGCYVHSLAMYATTNVLSAYNWSITGNAVTDIARDSSGNPYDPRTVSFSGAPNSTTDQ